jgi:hypothetical protein
MSFSLNFIYSLAKFSKDNLEMELRMWWKGTGNKLRRNVSRVNTSGTAGTSGSYKT